MSDLKFEPVTLERMDEYVKCLAACPHPASDVSFTNVWGWAEEYGLEWAWGKTHVWIRQTLPEVRYWAPVGPWQDVVWSACPHMQHARTFHRVPELLANIWKEQLGDSVTLEEARGQWDYVYLAEDLSGLRGNKFHKKKNHVNQFKKHYNFEYHPLTPDCIEQVLEMQEEWCQWRECEESEALLAENEAVVRVLEAWDVIPELIGGALYVDSQMVAYTVGEALNDDTLVVHFEKGKNGYRGVYQAINNFFVSHEGDNFTYVNREQDLDDEGLRKAKLSYHPADFVKKFTVSVK